MTCAIEYDLRRYEAEVDQYDFYLEGWNSKYKIGKTCPSCLSKKITLDDDGCFCEECKSIWEPGEDISDRRDTWIEKAIKEVENDV